jgi:hypothetical protein
MWSTHDFGSAIGTPWPAIQPQERAPYTLASASAKILSEGLYLLGDRVRDDNGSVVLTISTCVHVGIATGTYTA